MRDGYPWGTEDPLGKAIDADSFTSRIATEETIVFQHIQSSSSLAIHSVDTSAFNPIPTCTDIPD